MYGRVKQDHDLESPTASFPSDGKARTVHFILAIIPEMALVKIIAYSI